MKEDKYTGLNEAIGKFDYDKVKWAKTYSKNEWAIFDGSLTAAQHAVDKDSSPEVVNTMIGWVEKAYNRIVDANEAFWKEKEEV
jgi:hypothetical protein